MGSLKNDRLLWFARWVLNILLVGAVVLGIVVAAVTAAVASGHGSVLRRFAERGIGAAEIPSVVVLLVMVIGAIALGFFFLRSLKRIVDSAAQGDPFVPVNAERLRAMGWLVLAMQLLALVMPLVVWFDSFPDRPNIDHGENGISIGMMVMALLLFILARVFRVGAQMREELDGTV